MTISFISQGTTPTGTGTGTGTTSVTPALPGTLANGDIVLIYVGNKPDTSTPTTPANWNLAGTIAGGTGSQGIDTGPVRTTVFWRIKDASWSTMPAISITSNSSAVAQAFVYRNASGLWDIAASGGADTTTGTAWSVTTAADPGFAAGDWAFVASTLPTDVGAGAQFASESISATGISVWGTMTERAEQNTSSGNDLGGFVFDRPVTTGTSSAAPVVTATASGTTTNVAGTSLVVRLREVTAISSAGDGNGLAIAETSSVVVTPNSAGTGSSVTVDAVGPSASGSSSATWSHTCGASATILIVDVVDGAGASSTLTCTYNGVSMTKLAQRPSNDQSSGYITTFYLMNPPTGSAFTVSVSTGNGGVKVGGSVSYNNVASIGSPVTAAGASGNPTANVSSATGHMVHAGMCNGNIFTGTSNTLRWRNNFDTAGGADNVQAVDAPGAASVTVGGTTTSDWWALIAVDLVSTGTPPSTPADTGSIAISESSSVDNGNVTKSGSESNSLAISESSSVVAADAVVWFTDFGTTTPKLLMSAEDWGVLPNASYNHGGDTTATWDDYFSHRAAQGYNCVQTCIFGYGSVAGFGLDGAVTPEGGDVDGVYPFNTNSNNPNNTNNSTWWTRRDNFFAKARQYGFHVILNITTPNINAGTFLNSWTTAQWQTWGTKIGTYLAGANLDHVMIIVADDYFGTKDAEMNAMLTNIRAAGATQPIAIQWYQETSSRKDIYTGNPPQVGGGNTTNQFSTNANYNFGYSYNVWYDVTEKMMLENNTLTPIPYITADGTFLNTGTTGLTDKQLLRRQVWWALSSGAKGVQVGDNNVWTWPNTALAETQTNTFYTQVIPAITTAFRALPNWHLLKADTSNQLVTAGRGTHASPLVSGGSGGQYLNDSDSYVTASFIQSGSHAGELAVIYMSHASTITIDQTKMVSGYTAKRIDPKNGTATAVTAGSTYNSGSWGTNSDGQNDWVLVLQAAPTNPSGTESTSIAVSETSAVASSSSGTESNSLAVADSSSVTAIQSASESNSLAIAETSSIVVTQSVSESNSIAAADASSVLVSLSASESNSLAAGDSSQSSSTLSVSESDSISIAETSAAVVALSTTDTSSVSVSETSTPAVFSTAAESEAISIAETTSGFNTTDTTDTGSINIADISNNNSTVPGTESVAVSISEIASILVTLTATESNSLAATETSSPLVSFSTSESEAVSVAETSAPFVSFSTTDTGSISVADSSSVLLAATLSASDSAAVSIDETQTSNLSTTTSDANALVINETTSGSNTVSTTDTGSVAVSEVSNVDEFFPASESVAVSITEQTTILATLPTSDTSALVVDEASASALSISVADGNALVVSESTQEDITFQSTDSAAVSVAESQASASTLNTSDTGAVSVSEVSSGSNTQNASDTGSISVADVSAITLVLSASDTGSIAASEGVPDIVVGGGADINGSDTSALVVTEATSVTIAFSATDTGAVGASEADSVAATVNAVDSGATSIAEAASILVAVLVNDGATVSVVESTQSVSTLNTTDTTAISVNDQSALTPIFAGQDTVAIRIDETSDVVVGGVVSASGSDATAVTITEQSTISITLASTDTSAIAITESKSFAPIAFSSSDSSSIAISETVARPVFSDDDLVIAVGEFTDVLKASNLVQFSSADNLVIGVRETNDMWVFGAKHIPIRFASSAHHDTINRTESSSTVGIWFTTSRRSKGIE